jgi:thioredoxin-dependent peroxiredoxin
MKLKPGMQAPEIGLPDASGKMWTLWDLAGSPAIVYFYPADDTPGCTAEACDFRDSMGDFQKHGYKVLGVSPQGADSHNAFAARYHLNFPLLVDADLEVAQRYGAVADETHDYKGIPLEVTRSTFVLDPSGRLIHALYGFRGRGHVAKLKELLGLAGIPAE